MAAVLSITGSTSLAFPVQSRSKWLERAFLLQDNDANPVESATAKLETAAKCEQHPKLWVSLLGGCA